MNEIYKITKKDVREILSISNNQLGKNYISQKQLEDICNGESSMQCVVIKNKTCDTVIGFCIYDVISFNDVLAMTMGKEIEDLKFEKLIGYIKTIAIDSSMTGTGMASMVVSYLIDYYKECGVNCLISTVWKHGDVVNAKKLLLNNGFVEKLEIDNYWLDLSIKEKFKCPHCGYPCHCSCVFFVRC